MLDPDPYPNQDSMNPDPQHCVKVPLTCFVGFQSWFSFRSKSATKLPLQKREDRVTVVIFLKTKERSMNALRNTAVWVLSEHYMDISFPANNLPTICCWAKYFFLSNKLLLRIFLASFHLVDKKLSKPRLHPPDTGPHRETMRITDSNTKYYV